MERVHMGGDRLKIWHTLKNVMIFFIWYIPVSSVKWRFVVFIPSDESNTNSSDFTWLMTWWLMTDDTRQRSDLPYNQHLHNPRVYFASSILNLIKSSQSLSQNHKNYGSIDRRFLDHITIGHRPVEQCRCVYQHGTIETMGHGPIVIVILQITAFHGYWTYLHYGKYLRGYSIFVVKNDGCILWVNILTMSLRCFPFFTIL